MPPQAIRSSAFSSPGRAWAATRIQAAFRGFRCRKVFRETVLREALDELAESEEWERDELGHWEAQEAGRLWAHAAALQRACGPALWETGGRREAPCGSPDESLRAHVRGFCAAMDRALRGTLQGDLLRGFLAPAWRRRSWDLADDTPALCSQLDAVEDCVKFTVERLKGLVDAVAKLDPAHAAPVAAQRCQAFLQAEDHLQCSMNAIEAQLDGLVGTLVSPAPQLLQDLEAHVQQERECSEEAAYLQLLVGLAAGPAAETKFHQQRRLRRSVPRPGSAGSGGTGSSGGSGSEASPVVDLLARFQRWRGAALERACERWQAVLRRRERNLLQATHLLKAACQDVSHSGGGGSLHSYQAGLVHSPVHGLPLYNCAPDAKIRPDRPSRWGSGSVEQDCWRPPRPRHSGKLGVFPVSGWEEGASPPGVPVPHSGPERTPRSPRFVSPLKGPAKLCHDTRLTEMGEFQLPGTSLRSLDDMEVSRGLGSLRGAMPT